MILRSTGADQSETGSAGNAAETLWSDLTGQVRLSRPELVRGWFPDLELTGIDAGVLVIHTRNDAQARYLEEHCRPAFIEAAQAATGRLVSVEFQSAKPDPVADSGWAGRFEGHVPLHPEYTLDHFVTGPCNRLAHAAAVAIADAPGQVYNPFFVHGPCGLGKTHLLQSICHTIRGRDDRLRVHYLSCETFVNDFMEAAESGFLHQFRHRYRFVDVLAIDDIQFLSGRERSQEAFFHTFNTLYQSQRQIVLSANGSPAEMPSLAERLVSRFGSGLVAMLDPPCLETRIAILRKKAKLRCIEVPAEVLRLVACSRDGSIRELEGMLTRLDALSQSRGCPITPELASFALGAHPSGSVGIPSILGVVSKRFGVRIADLQSTETSEAVAHPRRVSMYLARKLTSRSLEEIGGHFGARDRRAVLEASRFMGRAAEDDPTVASLLKEITDELKSAV